MLEILQLSHLPNHRHQTLAVRKSTIRPDAKTLKADIRHRGLPPVFPISDRTVGTI
jgi:hypothetical protein